jgi:hypothetical protein
MKVTASVVRQFESDQVENGTAVAIHNILWLAASEQLDDLGVKNIKTTYHKAKKMKGKK